MPAFPAKKKQSADQRQRYVDLTLRLKRDLSWKQFADRAGIDYSSVTKWVYRDGAVGPVGQQALARFCDRRLEDLEAYANEQITLDELLDPQFGRDFSEFDESSVSVWLRYQAPLDTKVRLHGELGDQIGSIALRQAAQNLRQQLQGLLDRGLTLPEVAAQSSLTLLRIEELYRGDRLPCEGDLLGLSEALGVAIEELRATYITGD